MPHPARSSVSAYVVLPREVVPDAGPSSVGLALYLSTVVSGVSSLSQLQVW